MRSWADLEELVPHLFATGSFVGRSVSLLGATKRISPPNSMLITWANDSPPFDSFAERLRLP